MDRLMRDAVLIALIEELQANRSWCGETHIQRATYFLQEMLHVPSGFEFVLYKHGPFSFELCDELTAMRADYMLHLQSVSPIYGPSYGPGRAATSMKRRFPRTLERYRSQIEFVARNFGDKDVKDLERLATALLVIRKYGTDLCASERAQRLCELKPHITHELAIDAVNTVSGWDEEAEDLLRKLDAQSSEAHKTPV